MSSVETLEKPKRPRAMVVMNLILQVAKRIGFGKPVVSTLMGRMMSPELKARAFAGYEPDEHDVFVATFAKSGTNWMMQISQQIAHHGAAEFDHIHQLVPWPDGPGGPVGDLRDPRFAEESPTGLRIIKTHLETEFVPYAEAAKYLCVIRDPKEVLVSSYYFLGGLFGVLDRLTIDDWYSIVMGPGRLMDHWAVHTASFWEWRERDNVLVVNYREVIKEPVASIELVARTMGVELTPAQLDHVVERSSFAWMSANESRFAPPPMPFNKGGKPVKMVRSGKSGDSGELLSPEQQREIDRHSQAALAELGSDFPYVEAFGLADDQPG